jgi:fucose permease
MATTNTLLQTMSPDELRGRVMSVFMLTWGLMPLGTLPAGAIASSLGAPFAVGLGGLICLVFVLLLTARQPKLWHLS